MYSIFYDDDIDFPITLYADSYDEILHFKRIKKVGCVCNFNKQHVSSVCVSFFRKFHEKFYLKNNKARKFMLGD